MINKGTNLCKQIPLVVVYIYIQQYICIYIYKFEKVQIHPAVKQRLYLCINYLCDKNKKTRASHTDI